MRARNTEGEIVEVTKKTYSTLYRYRGWTLVKDDEGKVTEPVPEAEITPEEIEAEAETAEVVSEDKADEVEAKEVEETNKDLSKLKKAELQKLVSDKGLEFKADDTKEDLINLLNK